MADPTPHFTAREFECRCGCGYGSAHPRLLARLEALRSLIGDKPIRIVSGLRCPPHNRAVGGASRSRHQSGEGVDIPAGLVRERQAREAGFTGIGLKGGWVVHVDTRRTQQVVTWTY